MQQPLGGASPTATVTEVLVPDRTPTLATKAQEYHYVIAGLQSDVLIANLQAEVKSLLAQLLGAPTPSTVTESLDPKNSDRMTKIELNMANWMSEMRQLQQSEQKPRTWYQALPK
jgi:hypothetical protein